MLAAIAAGCVANPAQPNFSGTYVGNVDESVLLPGDSAPKDLQYSIRDEGETLTIVQTYVAASGERVRLVWTGACDDRLRPIEGALFGAISMSCRREHGALVSTVVTTGWRYTEACVMTSKDRLTCSGQAPTPEGEVQFKYVLDRI
ncbi:MAG TPA: hypothetical protein VHK24_14365 [Steroidobacter sp.]|nr:hypothetical protein [Steroidobacter sp.]